LARGRTGQSLHKAFEAGALEKMLRQAIASCRARELGYPNFEAQWPDPVATPRLLACLLVHRGLLQPGQLPGIHDLGHALFFFALGVKPTRSLEGLTGIE
jgi:hypothetical protein